jgi:dienelactone hydrolase
MKILSRFRSTTLGTLAFATAFVSLSRTSEAKLVTRTIEYKDGKDLLEGYLAFDDQRAFPKAPGVLVIHEWMGMGPYVKRRANELAQAGYVAFAADIYGKDKIPKNVQEASEISLRFKNDRKLLRHRAQLALDVLRNQKNVDSKKLAAIGYCFGGTAALELARSGAPLAAVVSFHGGLDTPSPADAKNIKAKILVLAGGDDPHVPDTQIDAFKKEMRAAHVDWQLHSFGGAVHSFTNPDSGHDPSKGAAYNASADRRSWELMQWFFDENFGARPAPKPKS